MKLCICGDRNITDYNILIKALEASKYTDITEIVSGHCKGADKLGEEFARKHSFKLEIFEPDWKDIDAEGAVVKTNAYGKYNARAGHDRNERMAKYCDAVLALQTNGPTPGTSDMIKRVKALGKPVFVYTGHTGEYEFHF